jgi:hypothetical protein
MLTFDGLIDPLPASAFFAEHWERKLLFRRRGDAHYYDSLLTNGDLERIISNGDLRFPALQISRHGGYFPPEAYTRNINQGPETFTGVPDLEKVRSEYRNGATIVLPGLHRTWSPLRDLCVSLENLFSHAVHANAYLTAGNTTGLSPHYDTHDVFVLQLGGKKRWRVYPPPIELPHRSQPFARSGYVAPEPLAEFELLPGDLLYFPRGHVHAAATSDSYSAHVTLGVTVYTWIDLLSELSFACAKDKDFREALPVGFARSDEAQRALHEGLCRRLASLPRTADVASVAESFTQRVRATRGRPGISFTSNVRVIGPTTRFETPEKSRYVIGAESGNTVLELDGRKLLLPAGVRPTLDAICGRTSFRLEELPKHLEDHATLAFVQFLESEGFLRQAPDASAR